MKTWHIDKFGTADGLVLRAHPDLAPGPREVVVRVRASALNSRDLKILQGSFRIPPRQGLVPLSDGAGEVLAVGDSVKRFKPGDRVAATFHQRWPGGRFTREAMGFDLGGSLDGMLAEQVCLAEDGLVHIPAHLSFEEAAALPCAGVTAWCALHDHVPLAPGETVLTLGTGGVSLFAVQFAKLAGARVIATTSSADKAARLKALGADEVINYRDNPDWEKTVLSLTGGRGVDHVIEVGGPGTLPKSVKAVAVGGQIALIGILAGAAAGFNPDVLRGRCIVLRSTNVGSRQSFEAMNRAIESSGMRPVVDKVFAFDRAADAYGRLESQGHFGKVVVAGAE